MYIDTKTFQVMKGIIRKKGWIDIPAYGTSMFPLIKKGNICRFASCEKTRIKKGDVLLFQTQHGNLVAHRFVESINQEKYLFKGDTNLGKDEPVSYEKIIGKLVLIRKEKINIKSTNIFVFLWSKMIITFPMLSAFLRMYLNKKESRKLSTRLEGKNQLD
jgi:signal peptidase